MRNEINPYETPSTQPLLGHERLGEGRDLGEAQVVGTLWGGARVRIRHKRARPHWAWLLGACAVAGGVVALELTLARHHGERDLAAELQPLPVTAPAPAVRPEDIPAMAVPVPSAPSDAVPAVVVPAAPSAAATPSAVAPIAPASSGPATRAPAVGNSAENAPKPLPPHVAEPGRQARPATREAPVQQRARPARTAHATAPEDKSKVAGRAEQSRGPSAASSAPAASPAAPAAPEGAKAVDSATLMRSAANDAPATPSPETSEARPGSQPDQNAAPH